MSTSVYVLYEGDRHEGCHVISVHTTFDSAVEAARVLRKDRTRAPLDSARDTSKTSSYDYIQIEEVPFEI